MKIYELVIVLSTFYVITHLILTDTPHRVQVQVCGQVHITAAGVKPGKSGFGPGGWEGVVGGKHQAWGTGTQGQ